MTTPAYLNAALPVDDRVADLVESMDIDEKLAQLGAVGLPDLMTGRVGPRQGAGGSPSWHRPSDPDRRDDKARPGGERRLYNQMHGSSLERTRLGIPIMVHEESLGVIAPGAPPCSLRRWLWRRAGTLNWSGSGGPDQAAATGGRGQAGLAPVLDVARDPRWGRVEETYGEDPVLAGSLGAAYVRACRPMTCRRVCSLPASISWPMAFLRVGRNHAPVQIGPRELREVYAEPFAAAIREAGLGL